MKSILLEKLQKHGPLVLDGAMATELEKMGVKTANDLWSAAALLQAPAKITQVHCSYFEAGADIATANTYQANWQAFEKRNFSSQQYAFLIDQAVNCAKQARKMVARPTLIAGSIGPYGAFLADGSEYTGDYWLSEQQYQKFHYPRLKALAESGIDLLAIETQPNFAEVRAIIKLLAAKFPALTAWVSFSIADPKHLCDGTLLATAIDWLNDQNQVVAIGVNCIDLALITPTLKALKARTNKPLIVYPNNGDYYDLQQQKWIIQNRSAKFAELVPIWLENGAQIIGGCCRTTPADIQKIKTAIENYCH
jgi:homocysteine S-methyltransferase